MGARNMPTFPDEVKQKKLAAGNHGKYQPVQSGKRDSVDSKVGDAVLIVGPTDLFRPSKSPNPIADGSIDHDEDRENCRERKF